MENLLFSMMIFIISVIMMSMMIYNNSNVLSVVLMLLYVCGLMSLMCYTIYSSYNVNKISSLWWMLVGFIYYVCGNDNLMVDFDNLEYLMLFIVILMSVMLIIVTYMIKSNMKMRKL